MRIRFMPGGETTTSSANLAIRSNAPDSPTLVPLTGTSTGLPTGPQGPQGPEGPEDPPAKVTCKVGYRGWGLRVTCTVGTGGHWHHPHWRLMHSGHAYRHGIARQRRLRLNLKHPSAGRYNLRIQGRKRPVKIVVRKAHHQRRAHTR